MPVSISVIICTYNRDSLLQRALRRLAAQTVEPDRFEVIVVDDGSEDNTAGVCALMHRELPNLRYITAGTNRGIGDALNLGIKAARGDHILFTDDDCLPQTDWVEQMSAALAQAPLVAGAVASPVSNYIKLCHNIAQFHPFMPGRKAGPVPFIAGANMGFRRILLKELVGFEEGGRMADDMEFILRARQNNYVIQFVPGAVVTHDPDRTSLREIFRYAFLHAAKTILLRNQHRQLLRTPLILRSAALLRLAAPLIALRVTAGIYLGNVKLVRFIWTAPMVYGLKLAWCWGAARGLQTVREEKG